MRIVRSSMHGVGGWGCGGGGGEREGGSQAGTKFVRFLAVVYGNES